MRKIYFSTYLIVSLSLFITSCNSNDSELIVDTDKTAIEPDFFEKDGSINLEEEIDEEEEAPIEGSSYSKTYYKYNYTLLKPSDLTQRDVNELKCGTTKKVPLLVGASKKKVGVIKVSNDEENLYVVVKADDYNYLKKVYLYIGDKNEIPFYSNGFPNLSKFNYKAFPYYYGGEKKATYTIPLSSIDLDCFEVVAYAKVFNKRSWCYYSSFAYDSDLTQKYYYSYYSGCYYYSQWVRSFEYCKKECGNDYIQAHALWEDGAGSTCLENDNGVTFLTKPAYDFLRHNKQININLFINNDGCDISNAVKVGFLRIILVDEETGEISVEQHFYQDAYVVAKSKLYLGYSNSPTENDFTELNYDPPTSTPEVYTTYWSNSEKSLYISGKLQIKLDI